MSKVTFLYKEEDSIKALLGNNVTIVNAGTIATSTKNTVENI